MLLFFGDCLEVMKNIPDKSIDMILCDLPYGITACKWDVVIPFEPFWLQYKRIIKDNGCIALFGSEPFSSHLRMSNLKMYKYDWVWKKSNPSNFAMAKKRPLLYHEIISIFYKEMPLYNRQMIKRVSPRIKDAQKINYNYVRRSTSEISCSADYSKTVNPANKYDANFKNPSSIIEINSLRANSKEWNEHPTQKPVALLEYLIKTYTLEGETVLDNCMGSGSTGVACKNLNRHFIGIEKDEKYFEIAKSRIENHIIAPIKKEC